MGLKDTIKSMHKILEQICHDLKKSEKGNKAASQRVRTKSIKFSKIAKQYRKESILEERKTKKKKGTKKTKRKPIKRSKKTTRRRKKRR